MLPMSALSQEREFALVLYVFKHKDFFSLFNNCFEDAHEEITIETVVYLLEWGEIKCCI